MVGVLVLMEPDSLGEWQPDFYQSLYLSVPKVASCKADEMRIRIVKGWLHHSWPAKTELDAVAAKDPDLKAHVTALDHLKTTHGQMQGNERQRLSVCHG